LTIPVGTKEDMARNIKEQVSILQSLRKALAGSINKSKVEQ